ncbi:MAG: cell envelope integrity protein TolA [Gammaproteobacteria bacterium]|nr:cell envelope integrity protein TolA [Gammaproteobacteria bacterium]
MQKGYYPALFYAIVLHGALLALMTLSFAWRQISQASLPPPPLAIQAAVVDESMIEAELAKLEAADQRIREAEAQRSRELEEQAAKARAEREKEEARLATLARERKTAEKRDQELAEQRQKEEQERKIRDEQAADDRRKREETEKLKLADLEQTRLAEEKRVAALAEKRKKEEAAAEAVLQAEREEQLRRAVAEETARREAEEGGLLDEYKTLISQRIVRNWNKPDGVQVGLKCELLLTQIPGGEVTDVQVISCNGDAVVVRSIEAAVRKASPLPPPADPRLFDRKVRVLFEPDN